MDALCPCCGLPMEKQGDLLVSLENNSVAAPGGAIRLTPQQTELVYALSRAMPRIVPKDSIVQAIWGVNECDVPHKAIEVLVSTARKKLKPLNIGIECVRERGYRMVYIEGS